MSNQPLPSLNVVLLEDDPRDAELVIHAVCAAAPGSAVRLVDSRAEFIRTLDEFAPDLILSDHAVAGFNSLEAFRLAQSRAPGSPFILVSGMYEGQASECLQAGAAEFISKSDLPRLHGAIAAALALRAPLRTITPRQRQVLQLPASGSSTRDIARQLGLSIKTVETHRAQVMKRLGIHELAGLVRYAVSIGLVSTDR